MATAKQEQLYNEIIEYYSFADRLIKIAEEDAHNKIAEEQFAIIEDVTNRLEQCADKITAQYIEFVKNGESEKTAESIRAALNDVMAKIEECRNRITMLYDRNENNDDDKVVL